MGIMIEVKKLGLKAYNDVWHDMKEFTVNRGPLTKDQLWVLEHHPVYTQGQAGKAEHILNPSSIPVVQADRGGQVTYHGPGQLVGYVLMDIKRKGLGIRTLVKQLEEVIIEVLDLYNIHSDTKCGAPGVYVDDKKIASIGLRVKNGCTYHGIALNVDMDLSPFNGINPCGFERLSMTQMSDLNPNITLLDAQETFLNKFMTKFKS